MSASPPALPGVARPGGGGLSADLTRTLQLVADTIVDLLGFEVAVINLAVSDDTMLVAAVAGPDDVRDQLLHRRQGRSGWATLLAASEPWGRLRFLDHAKSVADPADIFSWIPDLPVSDDPDAWHPEDSLFAPLMSADGRHLGVLSVDVPTDGKRPGEATRRSLEAFAVTAAIAIEHATLAAEQRRNVLQFQAVFDNSPVAIALLGPDARFISVNAAYCSFLARDREQLEGHSPQEFTHPDDQPATARVLGLIRSGTPLEARDFPTERRYLLPDGTVVWGRLHLATIPGNDGSDVVIAQIEDITERKRDEQRLFRQAHFDALTSLPNRALSMELLEDALSADAAAGTTTAVFFCDLDRLKGINDAHGHAVGDVYLREVSARIRSAVRDDDMVGRLSGDEFVVILHGLRTPDEATALAARVNAAVAQPLALGELQLVPSVSIGIAYGAAATSTADDLLAQADTAMYQAKRDRGGRWHLYDPTLSLPRSRPPAAGDRLCG